jgi:hypothetical protein
MKLHEIFTGSFELIAEMADNTEMPKDQKLERLTDHVTRIGEGLDDLVELLPLGFAPIAKYAVDNPVTDKWQRDFMWRPIAETLYQTWRAKMDFATGLAASGEPGAGVRAALEG